MANNEHQTLGAVLCDLHETKEANRKLLRENTDLKIQIAKLTRKVEWYEAFSRRRKTKNEN